MLSRNAQGLYWMSRYLERGGLLCRLLAGQFRVLHDRSVDDIDRSWQRIYTALGREPLGGELQSSHGLYRVMLADAYTLTDDLTFERQNPDSVISCFAMARENARQNRNHISHEMWTCLNVAYLDMRSKSLLDVWDGHARAFYLDASSAARAFSGWAENTMYRDHGWHFLLLGQFVERALQVSALVEAQLRLYPTSDEDRASDWESLLGMCDASAPYRRLHSIEYTPADVVQFLVADARLSHSVRHAVRRITGILADIHAEGPSARTGGISRQLNRASALLEEDWPARDRRDDEAACVILGGIRSACAALHERIQEAYFDYRIEDAHES